MGNTSASVIADKNCGQVQSMADLLSYHETFCEHRAEMIYHLTEVEATNGGDESLLKMVYEIEKMQYLSGSLDLTPASICFDALKDVVLCCLHREVECIEEWSEMILLAYNALRKWIDGLVGLEKSDYGLLNSVTDGLGQLARSADCDFMRTLNKLKMAVSE